MDQSAIPVRYAKALFELSIEQNIEKEVCNDAHLVLQTINDNKEFANIIASRAITQTDKVDMLVKILKQHINQLTLKFLCLVVQKRRGEFLRRIALEYIKCYNQKQNIVQVIVRSSVILTNQQTEKIKEIISTQTGKTPQLEIEVAPSLIGGYQVILGDKFYDMSVKGTLERIEQSFNTPN